MKFFVDTADVAEIRELAATGLLDGVTTNPSLVAKAGRDFKEIIAEICEVVPGPVSAEVAALDTEGMLKEGRALAKIANNVTVKVPLTWAGLKACKALTAEGTMVNVTLCFSANQALLAAKAGATFVSPFIGRLDDIGLDGMDLIREIRTIYDNYPALQTRDPRRLHPPRRPRQAGRPDRRRRGDRAAGRAQGPRRPPAHRQGRRDVPRRLEKNWPAHRLGDYALIERQIWRSLKRRGSRRGWQRARSTCRRNGMIVRRLHSMTKAHPEKKRTYLKQTDVSAATMKRSCSVDP